MRLLAFALLAIAPAAIVWLALSSGPPPAPARATSDEDPLSRTRLDRAEAEIERLRADLDRARNDISALRGALLATAPPQGPEGKGAESYLDEYVRSFGEGGRGSEYFRLVVDAYATTLRDRILRVVADATAPGALRASLMAMLARPEFRGDGEAIAVLVEVLRSEPQLGQRAAQTLRAIGDARTAATIESFAVALQPPARSVAIAVAIDLSAEPNGTVARLLAGAPDVAARAELIQLLRQGDDALAVQALRDASRMQQPVRLAAAVKLGTFRGEPFTKLADEWLSYETDPQVQAALKKARDQQSGIPSWHALKATGPPDAEPPTGDHPNAWATKDQDKGPEWLELTYDPPRRASQVRIYEVNTAGGVVGVETVDEGGTRRSVWSGADPLVAGGVFEVSFTSTGYRVRAVRIHLDTSRRPGWEEIDAVELVGPDGRAWAKNATASSIYGQ